MARKKTRRWVLGGMGLVVLALLFFWYRASRPDTETSYHTVAVDRGPIVAKVTATGTLSALVTVQVGSQVSGRIDQILVDFNSHVTKGQVIAKLDPDLFAAALEQARANYVAAKSNLTKAQVEAQKADLDYQRAETLAQRKLIAQADLDTAAANAKVAHAVATAAASSVEQARAALHQAQVNLAYTTIVSPIDGIVVSRNVDVGQTVAASFQAPTLFVIAEDLRRMQVDTNVSEADVGRLQPGMTAGFSVDAYPGKTFTGSVRQIRNAPQTVQNIVTYDAVIDVDNPTLELKPGMTANVSFIVAQKDDVLRVPNAALRFRPPLQLLARNGRTSPRGEGAAASEGASGVRRNGAAKQPGLPGHTVWVLRQGAPEAVRIVTGITDGTRTEVVSGDLRANDALITTVAAAGERGANASGRPPHVPHRFL